MTQGTNKNQLLGLGDLIRKVEPKFTPHVWRYSGWSVKRGDCLVTQGLSEEVTVHEKVSDFYL